MSRWKAAAIHLSISAVIGLVAAILIFGVWYPPPYGQATGATKLAVLLLGVDLVLGPLLTLVVFKAGKKSLKFDLSVIALLQACAFIYGMSVVVRARPVFIVAAVDRFTLITANDLDEADREHAPPAFRVLPWNGPRVIGAQPPADPQEKLDVLFSSLAGKDIDKMPIHYVDYAAVAPSLLQRAKRLSDLRERMPDAAATIDQWLGTHRRADSDVVWVPLSARTTSMVALLDRADGTLLGALPIDPW